MCRISLAGQAYTYSQGADDMSFDEIRTRVKPDLPRGNWAAVFRLSGIANTPIASSAYELFQVSLPSDSPCSVTNQLGIEHDAVDGAIYARFDTTATEGMVALRESTHRILQGIRLLGLDVEIEAHIDSANQISPTRPLPETYPYMQQDVTYEVRDIAEDIILSEPEVELDMSEFFRIPHPE